MGWFPRFPKWTARSERRSKSKPRKREVGLLGNYHRRLRLEPLEDRRLLTTYIAGGVYSTNMGTWTAAGSPYVLQSDVKLEGSAGALTIQSNVQVQGSGRLLVDDNGSGGSLTAQGATFTTEVVLYAGATLSLTGDSFATYNSFNETGVAAAAQEVNYLAGDTFPGNATMDVLSGPVTTSVYFPKISGLTTYSFDGNYLNGVSGVAVRGGGTLTIASGNTISGYYLKVDDDGTGGTLKDGGSGGVSFSNEVWLYTGATVSLTGDSFATYNSLNETGVAAAAQEVNYLAGDTFPGNATMDVLSGPVTTSVYFPKISGLTTYSFDGNYLNGVSGVAVRGGGTLTIASGNMVSGYHLYVSDDGSGGSLLAIGVTFGDQVTLGRNSTGTAEFDSFSYSGYNLFNGQMQAIVTNDNFNFSGTMAESQGSGGPVNLEGNYWGTTNLTTIEQTKIYDGTTHSGLPIIDIASPLAVAPALSTGPTISGISPTQPQATNGYQNVTLSGSNFDSGTYVNLIDNGGVTHVLAGSRILSLSSTQITINPNFTTAGAGTWKAEVLDGSGQVSGWYSFPVVAASLTAPTAPVLASGVTIWDAAVSGPAVDLSWTAATGTPTPLYDVYRNGSLESSYAANLGQTTFCNDLGLSLGQTYTYYILAHNLAGSAPSNTITVTIPSNLGTSWPGIPTGLTASATSTTSIHLAWTAVSAPGVSYLVYRSASATGPWALIQSDVAQASTDDATVQPATTCYYEIEATNEGGTSTYSGSAHATTLSVTAPPAPTIQVPLVQSSNQVILVWNSVISTGQYVLQRATTTSGNYATIQTFFAGTTSYTDTLNQPSTVATTYEYRLYSQVNGVNSAPSNVVQATLSVPVTSKTVSSGSLPTVTATDYSSIPVVYRFTGTGWTLQSASALQSPNFNWALQTIILTHGWGNGFHPNDGDFYKYKDDCYIEQFALNFVKNYSLSNYNVLAVDWSESTYNSTTGVRADGALGSDPDNCDAAGNWTDFPGDLLEYGTKYAAQSATNGIAIGGTLGKTLVADGMQPGKVMLIGHSNGAGFMASLATASYLQSGQKVKELVSLDAPLQTPSYSTTLDSAYAVGHIDNFYTPVAPTTLDNITFPDPIPVALGFGVPMLNVGNITNFEMNPTFNSLLATSLLGVFVSHFEIPMRYATTVEAGSVWGFAKSDFIQGIGNGEFDGNQLWQEDFLPGNFVPLNATAAAIVAYQDALQGYLAGGLINAVATGVQYLNDGAILLQNVANTAASALTPVYKYAADGAVVVSNELVSAANVVEQDATNTVTTLSNLAVSGAQYVASGVNSAVQQSVDTVENWLSFTAHSPTFNSFAVNVPANATFLTFDLTVTNPGNDDQLLVALGGNLLGQVDLASVEQGGTQTIQLPIGQYAGETGQTLTFYMPSSVSSTAQFVVGNVCVESAAVVTSPSVSDLAKSASVGGTVAFAATDFTAAFADPDAEALQKVMVTALPQHGTLKLGGTAVVLNQEIPVASLSTLSYTPATSYVGSDSFGWNGSDGSLYAVAGATVSLTVNAVWTATGGGTFSWGPVGNWQSGVVPGASSGAVLLGAAVGSGTATITLDAARTLSSLTFNPGTRGSYVLSGSNSLQLTNSGNSASIVVTSGTSSIKAPVVLGDNLNVTAAGGTSLTISGAISQSGGSHALTLSGSGSVTLSGTDTYTGGTTVSGGTLILTNSSAIAANTGLTVGANGTVIFEVSSGATTNDTTTVSNAVSAATSSDTIAATAVPSSASLASSSLVLLVPTTADVSASGSVATAVSVSEAGGDSVVQSVLPSPPAPLPRTGEGSNLPSPHVILPRPSLIVPGEGSDSDSSDLHHKKAPAMLALEAVFAQYGQ